MRQIGSEINTIKVSDIPESERPRERILSGYANEMKEHELLAVLLRTGIKGESVLEFSDNLIRKQRGLENLFDASVDDLSGIKGLGNAKIAELIACMELARRYNLLKMKKVRERITTESVTGPKMAVDYLKALMRDFTKEHFYVLSFDVRNRLIEIDEISRGTLTASLVHPRETFEAAIKRHAASIIVAHNHPSGDPEPSDDDIKISRRLSEGGRIMGIELLDHIIFTEENFISMKEKGLL